MDWHSNEMVWEMKHIIPLSKSLSPNVLFSRSVLKREREDRAAGTEHGFAFSDYVFPFPPREGHVTGVAESSALGRR